MRTPLAIAAVVLAVVAVLSHGGGVAGAHARLDESTPAVGEVVETSPSSVSITFTQDVQKIGGTYGIDVSDGGGAEVTVADALLSDDDRRILTVELPASLPVGRYVVEYKNVSDADGDPWDGAYAFYVGREPTAEELAADEALIGEEENATATAEAASTPDVDGTATREADPTTGVPIDQDFDDDNGGAITLVLVIGAIVLIAVLVTVGFFVYSRRTT
ncbi:MAG: copper resistance CopC family protein [Dehalococcoidia bacterium]